MMRIIRNHPSRNNSKIKKVTTGTPHSFSRKLKFAATCATLIALSIWVSLREHELTQDHLLSSSSSSSVWISETEVLDYVKKRSSSDEKQSNSYGLVHDDNRNKKSSNVFEYKPCLTSYPLSNIQNVTTPLTSTDVGFLWHIPKAAGSTVKQIISHCFQLTRAEVKKTPESLEYIPGPRVINIDTNTLHGIARAKEMKLVEKDIIDIFQSSYLHEGSALFTQQHKGRLFTFMRHPVKTVASLFFYLGYATWEKNYNAELTNMTLLDFASMNEEEGLRIDNWMTRYLSMKIKGPLTEKDLDLAKNILKYKCFIGLVDEFEVSMDRLISYLGLSYDPVTGENRHADIIKCVHSYNTEKRLNIHQHQDILPGSVEWNILSEKNHYDIQLYTFAKELWDKQGKIIQMHKLQNFSWNFRSIHPQ